MAFRKRKGWDAIEFASKHPRSISLCMYNSPIERAKKNISTSYAREIAAEDPGLIYTCKKRKPVSRRRKRR